MAASPEPKGARRVALAILALAVLGLFYRFPPFRIVAIQAKATSNGGPSGGDASGAAFDPAVAAARIWQKELPQAAAQAPDLRSVLAAVRLDPAAARTKFAHASALGTAYYCVRGAGRVVGREGGYLRIAVDGDAANLVTLRIGPVFGNTIRDGCGRLDVNAFPGLTEFNALATELNALVEKSVIPVLREKAVVGAEVTFAGCAEAPESAPAAGAPGLAIVPMQAEVRP